MLGLDVGRCRIGLAGCDPLGLTVTPLPAIHRNQFSQDLQIIQNYCLARQVKGLVIGLPLDLRGEFTQQAIYTERYGKRISKALELPLAWVNEQCSSWAAAEQNNWHGDRSGKLDSAAAVLLLEQWLSEGPEPELVHINGPDCSQVKVDDGS